MLNFCTQESSSDFYKRLVRTIDNHAQIIKLSENNYSLVIAKFPKISRQHRIHNVATSIAACYQHLMPSYQEQEVMITHKMIITDGSIYGKCRDFWEDYAYFSNPKQHMADALDYHVLGIYYRSYLGWIYRPGLGEIDEPLIHVGLVHPSLFEVWPPRSYFQ